MSIGIVLRSHDRFTASALARVVMLVLAVCLFAGSAAATDVSPLEAEVSSGTAVEVPDSLRELLQRGGTPTSLEQMMELENLQRQVAQRVADCTVNVSIGPAQGCGVIVDGRGYIF